MCKTIYRIVILSLLLTVVSCFSNGEGSNVNRSINMDELFSYNDTGGELTITGFSHKWDKTITNIILVF